MIANVERAVLMNLLHRLSCAMLVATLIGVSACSVTRMAHGAELYYGFTLIDPATEKRLENAWVVVEDGQLARIGSGQPPLDFDFSRAHDLSGKFALPGFIDAHAHVTSTGILKVEVSGDSPVITMESDDRITQHNARIALARGVTTVRNPGGDPAANARYDRMIAAGTWIGPEARHAGKVIQPPPFSGGMYAYPRTEEQWDAEAAYEARLGTTYFKLYTDLTETELATGIRIAHKHGMKAIAHLNRVSWTRAIELGIDGLEHALPTSPDLLGPESRAKYLAELDGTSRYVYRWFELVDYADPQIRRMVDLLARRKIATNMTLIVNELMYNIDQLDRVLPAAELMDMHPDVLKVYELQMRASAIGWTPKDHDRARAVMPKVLQFARMLHEAGVPMMIGTDAGGGILYDRELVLHREAGISAWDVLRMATSTAADILGMGDRIGRIAEGYEADLTILEADPLADMHAASQVYAVLNDGILLESSNLRAQ